MTEPGPFTVGGTVQAGSGLYISRRADEDLLELCRACTFAYILCSRQVGKSSLMIRAAERLAEEGVRSVILDLTKIGSQVSAKQWYLGLLTEITDLLMLDTDIGAWWQKHAHLGLPQRLVLFLQQVVLAEVAVPLVVFVDEIDSTLGLKFTDDFFATIRYLYNARAHVPEFRRLSFVLIGVATPGDLIRDPQRTPFNIGQRIDVTDWTFAEVRPLADGLGLPALETVKVLGWVLHWTGGHPYLTQRLCRAITDERCSDWSEAGVDRVVANTFFGAKSKQDTNMQFVRDMLTKRARETCSVSEVLSIYRDIRRDKHPVADEAQSLVKSHLKLSGIVRSENAVLHVRNRIYEEVFNDPWIEESLKLFAGEE